MAEKNFIASVLARNPEDIETHKIAECNAADGLVAFVAQLEVHQQSHPQSLFARTWNEVLGPRAIPFGPTERAALVDHGRKHPELKAHIERWEKMKAENSKWVRGELLTRNRDVRQEV